MSHDLDLPTPILDAVADAAAEFLAERPSGEAKATTIARHIGARYPTVNKILRCDCPRHGQRFQPLRRTNSHPAAPYIWGLSITHPDPLARLTPPRAPVRQDGPSAPPSMAERRRKESATARAVAVITKTLSDVGDCNAGELAEMTGLARSTLYRALPHVPRLGTEYQDGRTIYFLELEAQ